MNKKENNHFKLLFLLDRLRHADYTPLFLCWATAVFYFFFCISFNLDPLGLSDYPTYTLQAYAWRNGHISLGREYPLELAFFQGDWYVSFPPVPSIPLFFLTFFFGFNTPENLLVKLYVLGGCLSIYALLKRSGYSKCAAAGFSLLCSFASCLLSLTTQGAVWYQAQTLAFLCITAALTLMFRGKPTLSLVFYAFSVGCRPFHALYGILLYALYFEHCKRALHMTFSGIIKNLLSGTVLGLLIAAAYGWYNGIRFGNIFEFGHNYLPEFSTEGGVQFALSHIPDNVRTFLFSLPFRRDEWGWELSQFGFSFWIASPVFLLMISWIIFDIWKKRINWVKVLLIVCFVLHLFLLLLHRTFGGFQFGARYTCDLLPYAACYLALPGHPRKMHGIETVILIFALGFAIYGASVILL